MSLIDACKHGDITSMYAALKAGEYNYKLANEYACEHGGEIAVELAKYVLNYLKGLGSAAKGFCRRYWLDFNSHGLIGLCRRGNMGEIKHALGRSIDGEKLILYADTVYAAAYYGYIDVIGVLVNDPRFTQGHAEAGISGALAGSFDSKHNAHTAIIAMLKK